MRNGHHINMVPTRSAARYTAPPRATTPSIELAGQRPPCRPGPPQHRRGGRPGSTGVDDGGCGQGSQRCGSGSSEPAPSRCRRSHPAEYEQWDAAEEVAPGADGEHYQPDHRRPDRRSRRPHNQLRWPPVGSSRPAIPTSRRPPPRRRRSAGVPCGGRARGDEGHEAERRSDPQRVEIEPTAGDRPHGDPSRPADSEHSAGGEECALCGWRAASVIGGECPRRVDDQGGSEARNHRGCCPHTRLSDELYTSSLA